MLAHCEFETWFLASAESIAGQVGLRSDLTAPENPESIRGAKEWLQRHMPHGRKYSETIDQPRLASIFDLKAARRSPSFKKLYHDIERLCLTASRATG